MQCTIVTVHVHHLAGQQFCVLGILYKGNENTTCRGWVSLWQYQQWNHSTHFSLFQIWHWGLSIRFSFWQRDIRAILMHKKAYFTQGHIYIFHVYVGYWKDRLESELQYSHKCSLYSVSVSMYTVGVKRLKAAVKSRACRPMGRAPAGNSDRTGPD